MVAQIKSWGNSSGIRLPKVIMDISELHMDDYIDISVVDGNLVIKKIDKPFKHRTLEERMAEYGGTLAPDGEFDWGEPKGREMW